MSLTSVDRSRGQRRSSNAGTGGSENIMFTVKGYTLNDPKKMTPHPDDTIQVALWHDALGLVATFDPETNEPTTIVPVKLGEYTQKGANARPEVLEFYKGKPPLGKKMPVGAIMTADRAKLENGVIVAGWINRVHDKYDTDVHYPQAAVLAVTMPEYKRKNAAGESKPAQNTQILYKDAAVKFETIEQFREEAIRLVSDMVAAGVPGDVGFMLRGAETNGESTAADRVFPRFLVDQTRMQTAEEIVDGWLMDEDTAPLRSAIAKEGDFAKADLIWEVIPAARIPVLGKSLPSNRIADKIQNAGPAGEAVAKSIKPENYTDATYFQYHEAGNDRNPVGFAVAHVKAERRKDDETGEYSRWFNTGTRPVKNFGPIYAMGEVITPNLPADLAAKFEARATQRAKDTSEFNRNKAKEAAPAQAPAQQAAPEAEASQTYGM